MSPPESGFSFLEDAKFAEAVKKHGLSVVQVQTLAVAAIDAKARAYCPYSNFRVGAALLTKSALPLTNVGGAPNTSAAPLSQPMRPSFGTTTPIDQHFGQIIVGANIENCSYPVGTCAERAALATAISMGHLPAGTSLHVPSTTMESASGPGQVPEQDRSHGGAAVPVVVDTLGHGLHAIAVAADTDEPCSPCGMCRQFIRELVPANLPVFMFAKRGNWAVMTMGELLPMSFSAADLRGGQSAPAPVGVDTRTVAD